MKLLKQILADKSRNSVVTLILRRNTRWIKELTQHEENKEAQVSLRDLILNLSSKLPTYSDSSELGLERQPFES